MVAGKIFDTGAITHFVTGASIYPRAVVEAAYHLGNTVLVPTVVITAALRHLAEGHRGHGLNVLLGFGNVVTVDFPLSTARAAAELLAGARTDVPDIAAAATVVCAHQRHWPIVTDRAPALWELDPQLELEDLP